MAGFQGMAMSTPQDLTGTIPGQSEQDAFDIAVQQMPAGKSGTGGDAFDLAVGQTSGQAVAPTAQTAPGQEVVPQDQLPPLTGPELSPLPDPTGWTSVKEQVREAATRFKNSFAVTGPESVAVLKQSGLFEDVRMAGKYLMVKRPGRQGWEKFDRSKLELLGDTIDFSRDAFEGIMENSIRAGAIAAGTFAAPGAGTTLGAMGGGAVGATFAKNAGDIVAQDVLGIPKDPNRSTVTENAVAAGFGAGFGLIGSTLARRAAARESVRVEAQKTVDFAIRKAREATEDIATVKESGIVLGEHGNFKLDPQQLVGSGNVPELDATAKQLSTEESFRNARRQVGENIVNAYDTTAKALKAQAGHGADIADDFVLESKDVRKLWGNTIGSFRQLADEKLAGVPQVAPRTIQTIQMMEQSFTDASTGKMTVDAIIQNNPGLTETQSRVIMGQVNQVKSQLAKGTITIDAANALRAKLDDTINKGINSASGRPYALALKDLRDALRNDHMDMMEQVLPANYMDAYKASKTRYMDVMDATNGLGNMLEQENISRNELVGRLFERKDSYKFAMNAKTLIDETNPKLWNSMAGEYFAKLRNDATDPVKNTVNWGQISKKWGGLDERLQTELLKTTGIPKEGMNALIRLGTRIQDTTFEAMPRETKLGIVRGGIRTVFALVGGGATAKGGAIGGLMDGMGKDQALAKWLKDGGMEEVLREMPGLSATKKQGLRSWIADWTPRPTRVGIKQSVQTKARRETEKATAE